MSIYNSTTCHQFFRFQDFVFFYLLSKFTHNHTYLEEYYKTLSNEVNLIEYLERLLNSTDLNEFLTVEFNEVSLKQISRFIENSGYLNDFEIIVRDMLSMNLFNTNKFSGYFNQFQYFNKKFLTILLNEFIYTHYTFGHLNEFRIMKPTDVDLVQLDTTGPRLINITPPAWSSYQNPEQSIEFDIVDQEGASVVLASINVFINNYFVMSGGNNQVSSGFGSSTLTKYNDSTYHFKFELARDSGGSVIPFDFHNNPITVSACAIDNVIPANSGTNYYEYQVWNYSDMGAIITGGPDVEPPYLYNISPERYSVEVPVDSLIQFDLKDDHTGVKLTTVNIYLNDLPLVISGIVVTNTNYAITCSLINHGFRYSINPLHNFDFNRIISVRVEATDNFMYPNSFSDTFSFLTQTNNYLVISGLSILEEGTYVNLFNNLSYSSNDPSEFRVYFINTSGIPFDLDNTYLKLNGVTLSSTMVPISDDYLEVYFNLTPDYLKNSNVIFHLQQSGTVYGNIVTREDNALFRWGYEFCYNPEEKFEHEDSISATFKLYDYGKFPKQDAYNWRFETEPFPTQDLSAQIVPVYNFYDMGGYLVSNNTFFEYGKNMKMSITASDYSGNMMIYNWSFKIEDQ